MLIISLILSALLLLGSNWIVFRAAKASREDDRAQHGIGLLHSS